MACLLRTALSRVPRSQTGEPFALQQALAHRIPPPTGDRGSDRRDRRRSEHLRARQRQLLRRLERRAARRPAAATSRVRARDRSDTFEYAAAIQNASENGINTVVYPQSTLGGQLEIVARLISGGLGTPIFLTAEFGFDTHAQQAASHAQILGSVGSSVAAFLNDLRNQGLSQRVLVLTQSEFGRRVSENGSLGTDHGTAAPMLAVGDPVAGGVFGTNPDLTNLDPNGNLLIQHDYRAVYQTVLQNHFGASGAVAQDVLYGDFGTIPFVSATTDAPESASLSVNRLEGARPNPVRGRADVAFSLAQPQDVSLAIYDAQGRRIEQILSGARPAGEQHVSWSATGVAAGTYWLRLQGNGWERHARLAVIR
ncbi:MAG: DUF1501 domain-containing protein [Candidatus Eisenbacteria bacterium]